MKDAIIMGGHFMLFYNEASEKLLPGIASDITDIKIKSRIENRVGIFPEYTWELAMKSANLCLQYKIKPSFLILINDWQYVPENKEASTLRKIFYDEFNKIPFSFEQIMQRYGFNSLTDLHPSKKHPIAFPETWLKYRFQKSAKRLVKEGKLEKKYIEYNPGQSEISFIDSDGNYKNLISCGITGCAGEITEMIFEIYQSGIKFIIIFAPGECFSSVSTGVEIALNLYELSEMKVIITDPGGSGQMNHDEIYKSIVNFSIFSS